MAFYKLIQERESIRNYDINTSVAKEKLMRILDAGRLAPSACNLQPWKFYLISKPENLAKVHACYAASWLREAPHILVVAGKAPEAWTRKHDAYNSLETDLTIAMDHMILAAEAEGIGTCWIAAFDPEALKNTGLFEPDEKIFALTPLGYPKADFIKKGNKNRKSLDDVVILL
jgi:nitroreductase